MSQLTAEELDVLADPLEVLVLITISRMDSLERSKFITPVKALTARYMPVISTSPFPSPSKSGSKSAGVSSLIGVK